MVLYMKVFISINCSNQIDGDEVKLLITEIIRDDSNTADDGIVSDEGREADDVG